MYYVSTVNHIVLNTYNFIAAKFDMSELYIVLDKHHVN